MNSLVSTASGRACRSERPDALLPGARAGPWRVEHELGRGGMGVVYAVVHEEIGKRAALKVVHRAVASRSQGDRMLLEARVVNAVEHRNIVDIFDTGRLEDGRPYVVMERLDGQPLSRRVFDGELTAEQTVQILRQVCDALVAAHARGVVHRDLKPDNIFVVDNPREPSCPTVKLLDWGIARVLSHDVRTTGEGELVGTPQYLSPEQARGEDVTPQSDVYSLGIVAYELFLEQLPFEAGSSAEMLAMHLHAQPPAPSALWPDIPPRLADLLVHMLAKDPWERPTVREVDRCLANTADELANRRRPRRASAARTRSGPRRRWPTAVGVLALAASMTTFLVARANDGGLAYAPPPVAAEVVEPWVTRMASAVAPAPVALAGPLTAAAPTVAVMPTAVIVTAPRHRSRPPVRHASDAGRAALPKGVRRASASPSEIPRGVRRSTTSVAPRRVVERLDPDGTIDPYR